MEHTGNENIAAALKLLEEAAKQKKDELQQLMSNKYSHLKTMILEGEGNLAAHVTDTYKQAVGAATHARDMGVDKSRQMAQEIDCNVHANPWGFMAGAAAIGLLCGIILGRDRK